MERHMTLKDHKDANERRSSIIKDEVIKNNFRYLDA